MKVRDYLKKLGSTEQVTFIKARARKDSYSPFHHPEYQTTPIRTTWEWEATDGEAGTILDHVVLNDAQPPIEWSHGCGWIPNFEKGWLKCLLVISDEDFALLYKSEDQRQGMEDWSEKHLKIMQKTE